MTLQLILKARVKEAEQDLTLREDHYRENFTRENYEKMLSAYHDLVAARDRCFGAEKGVIGYD